jgi:hypothetical protein
MPCDVATIVAAKCGTCHGAEPVGGAPMSLTSAADFMRPLKSLKTQPRATVEVATLVKTRINDAAQPMPPGALLPEDQRAVLNKWLDGGHPARIATETACATANATDSPKVSGPGVARPDGTVCYQFKNHGQPMPGDTSPYPVPIGEHYVSFYFTAPWQQPIEALNFRTIYDNKKVMHHWLMYSTLGASMDGTFAPSIGTHIGDSAQLLAGWAVGGSDVKMPQDVGLQLPPPGAGLMIEWHFYNTESLATTDTSAIELCGVPQGTMKHQAGITWLGTENFNGPLGMPAKTRSTFGGTCLPSRNGLNATDPVKIFFFWPHMHKYGRHMQSIVTRADGTQNMVFDKDFDFNYQITYDAAVDLNPGDVITSSCTFENTSTANVAFGPSTDQEMCYQFAYSYPAGALNNGVLSLVGATNTCW